VTHNHSGTHAEGAKQLIQHPVITNSSLSVPTSQLLQFQFAASPPPTRVLSFIWNQQMHLDLGM